jgi:tellurite resistance protein TehA-like permease
MGVLVTLIFLGSGLMWLVLAMAAICKARPFPFNMGCLSCSAFRIGIVLPSAAFKSIATAFEVAVIIIWCVVAVGTTKGA